MAKTTIAISSDFVSRLHVLDFTRKKADQLFQEDNITRRDREQIYKGLFLESVVAFEGAVENLFLGLLSNQITPHSSRTAPKILFRSRVTARPIVFAGSYFDWFPYKYTKKRAEHFFRGGHPFSILTSAEISKIEEFLVIRNAVAHKSDHSKEQFETKVIGSTPILPRERKVGAYLAGNFRSSPLQTRYENLVLEMATIFDKICTA